MKAIIILNYASEEDIGKKTSIRLKNEENEWVEGVVIKPMPKRYIEDDFVIETPRDVEACAHGIRVGRNIVINEILGETE